MNKNLFLLLLLLLIGNLELQSKPNDFYVIFYHTYEGKTGHVGLAVDEYIILIDEENNRDTVKSGKLIYFDVWPKEDKFNLENVSKFVDPTYYRLSSSNTTRGITLSNLYYKGLPHKDYGPCDAIVKLQSNRNQDFKLDKFMSSVIDSKQGFNVRKYNCADFVREGVEFILNVKINAKEFIPFEFSTTPNQLFIELIKIEQTKIIKQPDTKKISGSFWVERIFKRELLSLKQFIINQFKKNHEKLF